MDSLKKIKLHIVLYKNVYVNSCCTKIMPNMSFIKNMIVSSSERLKV